MTITITEIAKRNYQMVFMFDEDSRAVLNDGTSDFKNKSFIVNLLNRNKDNDYHYMTESYQSPSAPVTSHSGHAVIGPGHMPVRQIDTLNSAVVPTSVVGALKLMLVPLKKESPGNRSANAHDMVEFFDDAIAAKYLKDGTTHSKYTV